MTAKILVGILIFLAAEIQVLLAIHFVVRFAVSRGVELQGTLIVSLTRRLQITLLASYIFGAIAILMVCQAVNTSWVWNGLYIVYYFSVLITLRYKARHYKGIQESKDDPMGTSDEGSGHLNGSHMILGLCRTYWPQSVIFVAIVFYFIDPMRNSFIPVVCVFAGASSALVLGRRTRQSERKG